MNDWAIKPSQWLAPPHSGMGYCWHCACSPGCTLTLIMLTSKLTFSAITGEGALLSNSIEGVLYKSCNE